MKTSDFYFDLPEELIAQVPILDRSSSKLMVLDKETGEINKIDFQTYLDAEKAFQGGIDEQNEIIADEDDVTPNIMEKINSGKKSKSKKKLKK